MIKRTKNILITICILVLISIVLINIIAKVSNEEVNQSEEVENISDEKIAFNLAEEYFNLLNAYYGEKNEYEEKYSKKELKKMLYDKNVKYQDISIDNFLEKLEVKKKAEYFLYDEQPFQRQNKKITMYVIPFMAGTEDDEETISYEVVIYIDKETNAYSVYFGKDKMSFKNFIYPKIDQIEKNENNIFKK